MRYNDNDNFHLILFPDQLFNPSHFKDYQISTIHIIEHPVYFGFRNKMKPMKFNKKKLILHRASILAYIDELREKTNVKINHVRFSYNNTHYNDLYKHIRYLVFDPVDHQLISELGFFDITILETPTFLNTTEDLLPYIENERFQHSSFYKDQISRHQIYGIKQTTDRENREAIPITDKYFPPSPLNRKIPEREKRYVSSAIKFVERTFPNNYGSVDDFWVPITRKEARKSLRKFLVERFTEFGRYQDAIIPHKNTLYHSVLSPMINIGLLSPREVVDAAILYYKRYSTIPYNSYEAFIRQIVGWREYQRLIYIAKGHIMRKSNYFKNHRKLTRDFYKGTTGIDPIDDAIVSGFKTGYLHHITRLMMMSNFMNLCQIHPNDIYRWFMEFAVDSYDWVMIGNVYSMGLWADEGLTMRKPYLSTGNYIEKMSGGRYKASRPWGVKWRALYYTFLSKNEKQLERTPYRVRIDANELNEMKKVVKKLHFLKN